jgi:Protein of unknown function (DUF2934)
MKRTIVEMARTKQHDEMLEHEIRMRAYDLYEERGKCDGHELEDWVRAEREVLRRLAPAGTSQIAGK